MEGVKDGGADVAVAAGAEGSKNEVAKSEIVVAFVGCPGSRIAIQSTIGRSASTANDHSRTAIWQAISFEKTSCAGVR
jgi:hypothetical protein